MMHGLMLMWCMAYACGLLVPGQAEPRPEGAITRPERKAWDVVRSPDGDFAFSMPAKPARETRNARGAAGTLEVLSYACAVDGSRYDLRRVRSPRPVAPADVIAELDHLKAGYLKGEARLAKETRIVVDGVIGEDLTYAVPPSQGAGVVTRRTRHFIKDHFYYALTAASPPDRSLPGDAARFLSSLTFEAIVKAHSSGIKAVLRPPAQSGGRAESNAMIDPARPAPEKGGPGSRSSKSSA
jgi:hypothetical protein